MMQTLARLQPERLSDERYFVFGSLDGFGVFSAFYTPLVASLGPATAHDIATAVGLAFWFAALLGFAVSLLGPGRAAILAAAAIIALNPRYGSFVIFQYGESFTTPRLFAEAFVLAGLALHKRLYVAAACMAVAAAVHPLMALPGIAVLGLIAASREPRLWLLAGAGLVLAVGLAWVGVAPFSRLTMRFDAAWFQVVYERCAFGFLGQWGLFDLLQVAAPLTGVIIGWCVATTAERQVLSAVSIATALGLAATLLGADLLLNVLITNLQPWRALWLFALVGNAFAAIAALRLPSSSAARPLLYAALACALTEQALLIPAIFSAGLFGVALAAHLWEQWSGRALPHLAWLLCVLVAALVAVSLGIPTAFHIFPLRTEALGVVVLSVGVLVLLAGTGLSIMLTGRGDGRSRRTAVMLGLVLAFGAAMVADRRTGWTRFVSSPALKEEVTAFLGDGRNVYWEGGVELLWFKQRRPSFFSCLQGVGAMFDADVAREWMRRARAFSAVNVIDFQISTRAICPPQAELDQTAPPRPEDVVRVCRELPELDSLVLLTHVPGLPSTEWRAPPGADVGRMVERRMPGPPVFYLYRCAELRSGAPS